MTDDFFERLRSDWSSQDIEIEALRQQLDRRIARFRAVRGLEILVALFGLAAGAWFLARGWRTQDLLSGLGGLTMLIALPVAMVSVMRALRRWPTLEDRSPEGVLRHALAHLDAEDRLAGSSRWGPYVLAGLAALLWALAALGMTPVDRGLILVTGIWLLSAVLALACIARSRARNARERRACEQLLAQYTAAETGES